MGLEKYENRTDTDIQANHMYNLFSFTKDQENNYCKNPCIAVKIHVSFKVIKSKTT